MSISALEQIVATAMAPEIRETGGAHNIQGTEFQKHWAVLRMFELTSNGEIDFLFLFEALQDVAILNSASNPSAICVYQIKKKSRVEWKWNLLTGIKEPGKKDNDLQLVKSSPLGKLYAIIRSLNSLSATGSFVSNMGCDLLTDKGDSFATCFKAPLNTLESSYSALLSKALSCLHEKGEAPPDLSKIHIERINMSPEDPASMLVGKVFDFLVSRSPDHAKQARSLVEALLIKVTSLSLRSSTCQDFEEMRNKCGFSKTDFDAAIMDLQNLPDDNAGFQSIVAALERESLSVFEAHHIKVSGARLFRRRLTASYMPEEARLSLACEDWVNDNPPPHTGLLPYVSNATHQLKESFTHMSKYDIIAQLLISMLSYYARS